MDNNPATITSEKSEQDETASVEKEQPYEKNPWLIGLLIISAIFVAFGPNSHRGMSELVVFSRVFLMCMLSLMVTFSFKRFSRSCCVNFVYCFNMWYFLDREEPEIFLIVNLLTMFIAAFYRKHYFLRNSLSSNIRFPVSILDLFTITLASVGYILIFQSSNMLRIFSRTGPTWKIALGFVMFLAIFGTGVNAVIWLFRRTPLWKVHLFHSALIMAFFTIMIFANFGPPLTFSKLVEELFWIELSFSILIVCPWLFFLLFRLNGTYLERFTEEQKLSVRKYITTEPQLGPLDRDSEVG